MILFPLPPLQYMNVGYSCSARWRVHIGWKTAVSMDESTKSNGTRIPHERDPQRIRRINDVYSKVFKYCTMQSTTSRLVDRPPRCDLGNMPGLDNGLSCNMPDLHVKQSNHVEIPRSIAPTSIKVHSACRSRLIYLLSSQGRL